MNSAWTQYISKRSGSKCCLVGKILKFAFDLDRFQENLFACAKWNSLWFVKFHNSGSACTTYDTTMKYDTTINMSRHIQIAFWWLICTLENLLPCQKWNSLCFAKCHNLGSAHTAWYYHQISMHIWIGLEQFHLAHWGSINPQSLLARGTSPLARVFKLINNSWTQEWMSNYRHSPLSTDHFHVYSIILQYFNRF